MSLNNNKSDTKDVLYGLIISQLLHDGHQEVVRLLQKKEGVKKISIPSDKLLEIIDHRLKNDPKDICDEDELILKHGEEVRAEVQKKVQHMTFSVGKRKLKIDTDMMVSIVFEQISLVGSKKMFDEVSKFNVGETYFLKEQMKLYQWRQDFFWQNFPAEFS